MLVEPLCHFFFFFFFFTQSYIFLEFRTLTCVVTSFRPHLFFLLQAPCDRRKFHKKMIFTIAQVLIKLGSSRLADQSHHHFDLTCHQEIDCLISGFSNFLGH